MITIHEVSDANIPCATVPGIAVEGSTREHAKSLFYHDADARVNLLRASGFVCSMLAQKEDISEDSGVPIPEIVMGVARIATAYIRGEAALPGDPMIEAARSASNEALSWSLDTKSIEATRSMNPALLTRYLRYLQDAHDKGFVILPLAKSAVPAGLLFHGMVQNSIDPSAQLYPIRYSTHKECHAEPRVDPSEYEFLRGLAEDRLFIVFDEDTFSAATLKGAMRAVSRRADIPPAQVHGLTLATGVAVEDPRRNTSSAFWHHSGGISRTSLIDVSD